MRLVKSTLPNANRHLVNLDKTQGFLPGFVDDKRMIVAFGGKLLALHKILLNRLGNTKIKTGADNVF